MTAPTRRGKTNQTDTDAPASTKTEPKRINVAVTPEIVRALEMVMENEQVSLTEAVRRLIGYGDFVYRAIKQDNSEVLIRKGEHLREIVLI